MQPSDDDQPRHHRAIRSFVVRAGRMTDAQERAWTDLWPRYGIDFSRQTLDWDLSFGRHAARTLEIGFGNGENLLALAVARPQEDFIGVEVHRAGVGHLLLRAGAAGVTNLRIICHDAVEVLEHQVPDASLRELLLYFPDPWPKKRHHKRRIIQPAFVELVARKLQPGGTFRLATDWRNYAEHMLAILSASTSFRNESSTGEWIERPASRPLTRFESRGHRLGHDVWDLAFRREHQRRI
jgi:tRNA (guanine-N7-)-methyltransferase